MNRPEPAGDLRKNREGYLDPTAYAAIRNAAHDEISKDSKRFHKLLKTIQDICEMSGFRIEGRLVVKDIKTGRIWR